jgi:hypothetical protein
MIGGINGEIDTCSAVIHRHCHARTDHPHRAHQQYPLKRCGILADQTGILGGIAGIFHRWRDSRQGRLVRLAAGRKQQDDGGDALDHGRSLAHPPRLLQGFPGQALALGARLPET